MQYALSHPSSIWMYEASSVCTVNDTRLMTRNVAAYMYFLRAASLAFVVGDRDRIDLRREKDGRLGVGAADPGGPGGYTRACVVPERSGLPRLLPL